MLIDTKFIDEFNKVFYETAPWDTTWCGVPIWKNPLDLWAVQTIIFENKPDVIIETGTYRGGSALYYAMLFDQFDKLNGIDCLTGRYFKRVYTIDIAVFPDRPRHPRIVYKKGSSADDKVYSDIRIDMRNWDYHCQQDSNVMVILDSDHSERHVSAELDLWSNIVTVGQYLIVEDTNVEGPAAAVNRFLAQRDDFVVDHKAERFLCTFNPRGFLKKVK